MKTDFAFLIMTLAAVSCGLQETGEKKKYDGIWIGPGFSISEEGGGASQRTVWYVTGFDYPDEYRWRSDPECGEVKCSLVVFANSIPMMKIPIGEEYGTSSDPDMHRVLDGDLYTDYSTDSLTVISRNGKVLFSYPGREMIKGMAVDGDDVYTLGQSRTGNGFSYRRNGEAVIRRERGYLFDHFSIGTDGHRFAFSEPVMSASGQVERYFAVVDGKVSQIAVRDDVKKVWDVCHQDGRLYYLASLVGIDSPVLVDGDRMTAMDIPALSTLQTCRLIPRSPEPYVEGILNSRGDVYTSGIWENGKLIQLFAQGMTVSASCTDGDGLFAVLTSNDRKRSVIYRCGETFNVPEGYSVMGACPLAVVDGILHVGLSSSSGDSPMVWRDGETVPLKFDGYIASVTTGQSSQDTVRD